MTSPTRPAALGALMAGAIAYEPDLALLPRAELAATLHATLRRLGIMARLAKTEPAPAEPTLKQIGIELETRAPKKGTP